MTLIQITLPENVNKALRHYCIDNNIKVKGDAIIKILEKAFSLDRKTVKFDYAKNIRGFR